ncbi:MAG: hypothetical protein M3P06_20330 [Acidobacteriota bacterium]|nr:hypothetical protein [Acidobacteriota bacterium]
MSGIRLVVGIIVMGIAVPVTLFLLLDLHAPSTLFTIAAVTFLAWGFGDLVSSIMERPRLKDRSPGRALREDWERRKEE